MSLLDRLALLRTLSGSEHEDCLGEHSEGVTFFPEQRTRFGIVSSLPVARGLLRSPSALAIDHVSDFIGNLPEQDADYVRFFLSHSPEFLNGDAHRDQAAALRSTLARLLPIAEALDPVALAQQLQQRHPEPAGTSPPPSLSSKQLARAVLADTLSQVFASGFGASEPLFAPDQFLENSGVFNAIPRAPKLRQLNQRLAPLIARTNWRQQEPVVQLLILVISLMGTMPLLATLTAALHQLLALGYGQSGAGSALPLELQGDRPFVRVLPVRFVLRRMACAERIAAVSFQADDVLFVYLASGNGCPIHQGGALPFGAGLHRCPGAALSRLLVERCLQAVLQSGLLARTVPSPLQSGHVDAFLSYLD